MVADQPDRNLTAAEVAKALFIEDPRTIYRWSRRGCPHTKGATQNKPHLFNALEVAKWKREQGLTGKQGRQPEHPELYDDADGGELPPMADAKLRLAQGQARKIELAIQKIEGALVDRDEADARISRLASAYIATLEGIAARAAPILAGLDDEAEIEHALRDVFTDVRLAITEAAEGE